MVKKIKLNKSTRVKTTEVDIDKLVNESKTVDMDKVNEVIEENKIEKNNEELVEVQPQKEEKITEDLNVEVSEVPTLSPTEIVEETENIESVEEEIVDNIDDVIAECIGEAEKKVTEDRNKDKEPWYVARAKRANDYFNW